MKSGSAARVWLERIGLGIVTVIALSAPFLFGLFYYVAVVEEGLAIGDGDPLREARVWMVRERRDLTGLGVQTTSSAASADPSQPGQCARTSIIFIKWDGGLRMEQPVSYCKCYQRRAGGWAEASVACKT